MLDHFNIPVSDIEKSAVFYRHVLGALADVQLFKDRDAYGFGIDHWQFGLYHSGELIEPLHVAFTAAERDSVIEFYQRALSHGVQSNGQPALRNHYGQNYYAAYVIDYDGHNIEAVCRQ